MNRALIALVVVLTVALIAAQTTAGPMILVMFAAGCWVAASRAASRAARDRAEVDAARLNAQINHDIRR